MTKTGQNVSVFVGGRLGRVKLSSRQQKDGSLPSPAESFRISWRQAMRGETMPISRLWEAFEEEAKP